jgi:peptidoglycan/xylan/chitin deacetylase (PgdA/CDA1 family)
MILSQRNVVFTYHGLHHRKLSNPIETKLFRNSIPENEYLKQLKTLKQLVKIRRQNAVELNLIRRDVFFNKIIFLMTFDDGYRNNVKAAEIFLDLFKIAPITIFLTTNLVGVENRSIWTANISLLILCGEFVNNKLFFNETVFLLNDSHERLECFDTVRNQLKKLPAQKRQFQYDLILSQTLPGELERLMFEYPEFRMLKLDEIKQMQALGVKFEPHGHNHEPLHSTQNLDVIKSEIIESKNYIEQNLNQKCSFFAYPNGDCCDAAISVLKENGFTGAYTTRIGAARTIIGNFEIPRITPSINPSKFRKQLRGNFF